MTPDTRFSSDLQRVLLVVADISGYTRFLLTHEKEIRHSQAIVGDLLATLIAQVDVPLEISRLEGDALFLYAVKPHDDAAWERKRRHLLSRLVSLIVLFADRVAEIGSYSICRCQACVNSGNLKLKVVVHSGEALFSTVGEYPTLSGVDVVKVHRLLKNSVEADQYVLMTEDAFRDLDLPPGAIVEQGVEEYDVGTIATYVYYPEVRPPSTFEGAFDASGVAVRILRDELRREYTELALTPRRGFHFNTGRAALRVTGYEYSTLDGIPSDVIDSFAGMGNPFSLGDIQAGEYVVDVGSGAGLDSLIAGKMTGPDGHVVGIEMTEAMLVKARAGTAAMGLSQVEFREGFAESIPVSDGWADVVISNGVINLSPAKDRVFAEMYRVLRPGGRLQIADIFVDRPVPEAAKGDIDLWTN